MSRKTGCYQQEQFNLHWENSVSDGSQCIINNRRFKMQRQRESKNCNSLTRQNNNFACVSSITLFCTFLCCHCTTTTWKCLISRFVKNVSKQWQNFLLFMNFDMVDRNSAPEEFACIWQSKRVGIITIETEKMWIHFSCAVFVTVSCRGIFNRACLHQRGTPDRWGNMWRVTPPNM